MRFLARRVLTGEWLTRDLPLSDLPEITDELSGPGSLTGTVTPEIGQLKGDDGMPLLDEWGTELYYEQAGQLRWGGLLVSSELAGPDWKLEAAGFTTYPHGIPYGGVYRRIEVDPLDVVRHLWTHVQQQPDSDLGMVVDGTTSSVTVGEPLRYEADLRKDSRENWWLLRRLTQDIRSNPPGTDTPIEDTADEALKHLQNDGVIFEDFSWPGMSQRARRFNDSLRYVFYQRNPDHNYSWPGSRGAYKTFLESVDTLYNRTDAEPYELLWWEAPDVGEEIDSLAKETPFDYLEQHEWGDADRETVSHRLRLGYPRLGRRRHDLRFVEGENVAEVVAISRDGDDFANEVVGLGAGEGRRRLRSRVPVRDGRLRRVHVLEDKSVRRDLRMTAFARDELQARNQLQEITSCTVWEHPHAPLGSFHVGDDIPVQAHVGWGEAQQWSRVLSRTYRPGEDRIELELARSDRFRYGG